MEQEFGIPFARQDDLFTVCIIQMILLWVEIPRMVSKKCCNYVCHVNNWKHFQCCLSFWPHQLSRIDVLIYNANFFDMQVKFWDVMRFLMLCNYCATMELSSSDEELHQFIIQTIVNPRQLFVTLVVPRSERPTKAMMQNLGTESAQLCRGNCDARAVRIHMCTGVRLTKYSKKIYISRPPTPHLVVWSYLHGISSNISVFRYSTTEIYGRHRSLLQIVS